jgi:hypothetical protein
MWFEERARRRKSSCLRRQEVKFDAAPDRNGGEDAIGGLVGGIRAQRMKLTPCAVEGMPALYGRDEAECFVEVVAKHRMRDRVHRTRAYGDNLERVSRGVVDQNSATQRRRGVVAGSLGDGGRYLVYWEEDGNGGSGCESAGRDRLRRGGFSAVWGWGYTWAGRGASAVQIHVAWDEKHSYIVVVGVAMDGRKVSLFANVKGKTGLSEWGWSRRGRFLLIPLTSSSAGRRQKR